jgi:uncharacterized RDD family membrane protein YckC
MIPASLPHRCGAMLYDSLLAFALLLLGTVPFVGVRGGATVEPGNIVYQTCMFLILFCFFTGFWAGYGRTLGMQSWRMTIENASGNTPTLGQASTRFFTAILSWLPLGLGFWWQLLDRDQLAWHDRLSGTRLRYHPKTGTTQTRAGEKAT